MAAGTGAGLLDTPRPQSTYKHALIDQYLIRFATMTASRLTPKRAVLVDGFAGRGRFDDGRAASAEYLMLAAQKVKATTQVDIFLVEQKLKDYKRLNEVADEYRGRGLTVETRRGDCGDYLGEVVEIARGASLFLFLDPCGAGLAWEVLVPTLKARGAWPRTEALMNFSADLVRRAGGHLKAGLHNLGAVEVMDRVCGGDWWHDVAMKAHLASADGDWEDATFEVTAEYTRRLCAATGMHGVVAPVRRQPHHQPVYFLVFLTHDPHGDWVFGHAASVAREKWLHALGPDEDDESGMLFPMDTVEEQIERERHRAEGVIAANIINLVSDNQPKKVVEHCHDVFRDVYGEARETTFAAVLRDLVKAERIQFVTKGAKPHQHVIRRGPKA
jgi:three-Cys-motif partner protein